MSDLENLQKGFLKLLQHNYEQLEREKLETKDMVRYAEIQQEINFLEELCREATGKNIYEVCL